MLGMKKDYRSYHNVKEILHFLKFENKEFILLTNNPDKIDGLKDLKINVIKTQSIEFTPNIYNRSYLISKERTGHLLKSIKDDIYQNSKLLLINP